MSASNFDVCFPCRFTLDLHVSPARSLIATLKSDAGSRSSATGRVSSLASSSGTAEASTEGPLSPTSVVSRRARPVDAQRGHGFETYGAAWPAGRPGEAIVFQLVKFEELPLSPVRGEVLEFHVSREFLTEHELDSTAEYAFKELENCPTLQLIVLRGDRDSVSEAQTREWQNRWCETLVCPGRKLDGLTVVETQPTIFGVITLNTQVLVIEGHRGETGMGRPLGHRVRRCKSRQPLSSGKSISSSPKAPRQEPPLVASVDAKELLQIEPLLWASHRFLEALNGAPKDIEDSIDPDRCIYVSSSTLNRLRLEPFSWALVDVGGVSRVVRVVPSAAIEDEPDEGHLLRLHASPQLVLNLSGNQLATKCRLRVVNNYPTESAIELSVAIIKSPSYNHQADFAPVLQWHFKRRPRLLAKGDVFAISMQEFLTECAPDRCVAYSGFADDSVLYLRVGMLAGGDKGEPESLWCHESRCTLYQSGATVAKVPRCMELVLNRSYHPVFRAPTSVFPDVDELRGLIGLFFARIQTCHSLTPLFLISGSPNSGKNLAVHSIAMALGLHLHTVLGCDLTGDTPAVAEAKIRNGLEKALSYGPCLLHVVNIEDIFKHLLDAADTRLVNAFLETLSALNRNVNQALYPVVFVATSNECDKIPSQVMSAVLYHLTVPPMSKAERRRVLELLLADDAQASSVDLESIAEKTAGFVLGNLVALVDFARDNRCLRHFKRMTLTMITSWSLADPILTMEDLLRAIKKIQESHNKSIGAPHIPCVRWNDVGGLEAAKKEILDTIQFPLRNPEIARGVGSVGHLMRSGILLYGPPGTGKTLLAKAVATECSLNFLSVKGPELINMYIGQSEDNVRKVFEKARSAAPCVIFFDELDSLAPRRGRSGDSGGVMDRVVSQLLAEMDGLGKAGGVETGGQVFVIGATNRPDLLDTALMRPGRLDRLVYVDIPEEPRVKLQVLRALTRKMALRDVDLQKLSEACPANLTGADLYSLCANAMFNAIRRCIETSSKKLIVTGADFQQALTKLSPSVSASELRSYRALRDKFAL